MLRHHTALLGKRIIAGISVEILDTGRGPVLLFLHPGDGFDPDGAFIRRLTHNFRVVALSHPGFGASEQPENFTNVEDLAHFYLDVLEDLDLRDVVLVGASFGGWIAAALAVKGSARIARVVLIDPIGAKFSGPASPEIAELFMLAPEALRSLLAIQLRFFTCETV
jgi:pimeloyl-ACP methyl ester carboxylesterase